MAVMSSRLRARDNSCTAVTRRSMAWTYQSEAGSKPVSGAGNSKSVFMPIIPTPLASVNLQTIDDNWKMFKRRLGK